MSMFLFSCSVCGRDDHGAELRIVDGKFSIASVQEGWRIGAVVCDERHLFLGEKLLVFLCSDVCQARYATEFELIDVVFPGRKPA